MISFLTWNCQGIKTNGPWLKSIINQYDVICLQETWLHDFEASFLTLSDNHVVYAKSTMPKSKHCMSGRPYGGLAVLVRSSLQNFVNIVEIPDNRLMAITLATKMYDLQIINVYFPVNCKNNEKLIIEYIGKISALIQKHDGPSVILGDFNLAPTAELYKDLYQMCTDYDCSIIDVMSLPCNTVTFSAKGRQSSSWLDHIAVSNTVINLVTNIKLPYIITPSDHVPIACLFQLNLVEKRSTMVPEKRPKRFQWGKASALTVNQYKELTNDFLGRLISWDLCCKSDCTRLCHKQELTDFCTILVECLKNCEAKLTTVGKAKRSVSLHRQVSGWNDNVKFAYGVYRDAYKAWINSGKDNVLYNEVSTTRKEFKNTLKYVRKRQKMIDDEKLATSHGNKNFVDFWNHVKRFDSLSRRNEVISVNGETGEANISEMWGKHYSQCFQAGQYAGHSNEKSSGINDMFRISADEVELCVKRLKNKKAPGPDGLVAESLKFASPCISTVIANFFNACLAHAFIPDIVMRVTLVPILKKSGLDSSKVNNYRPIALATVISKLFELIIHHKYEPNLVTHAGQFGYKKGVGTETAVFTLKQIAHHYLRKGSPVYICYLDATKAFDCVNHDLLLQKLGNRGFGKETLQLLQYWFNNQMFASRWMNTLSTPFPVRVGVRQGGINSAIFYSVYMDALCEKLHQTGLGCRVGSMVCNYIAYADDYCLMTTSIEALQKLINICEEYALEHNIKFNPTKTFCQGFIPEYMNYLRPVVRICGKIIQWVDSVKYLGFIVNCHDRDLEEIKKRRRETYAHANMVASRFKSCSVDVKKYIFKTYFSNIYCMSLWCPLKEQSIKLVQVAYNDSFRILFGYSRRESASAMFCVNNMPDFLAIRRRAITSLISRLSRSSNPILSNIYNSRVLINSTMYQSWRDQLLNTRADDEDLHRIFVCQTP